MAMIFNNIINTNHFTFSIFLLHFVTFYMVLEHGSVLSLIMIIKNIKCASLNALECSSKDIFDLCISESEREETKTVLLHINQVFNQAFEEQQTNQPYEINTQFF